MLRTSAMFMLVLAVAVSDPTPAHALKFFGWLDELSGPGPFDGFFISADVVCLGSQLTTTESLALNAYSFAKLNPTFGDPVAAFDGIVAAVDGRQGSSQDVKLKSFLTDFSDFQAAASREGKEKQTVAQLVDIIKRYPSLDSHGRQVAALFRADEARAEAEFQVHHERDQQRFRRCRIDRSNNIVSVQLELSWLKDDLKENRYPGHTRLTTMSAVAYMPLERIWNRGSLSPWGRWLEFGTGIGIYYLDGSTLRHKDMLRGAIPLRARVILSELLLAWRRSERKQGVNVGLESDKGRMRLRRFAQAFEYHYGQDFILGTIDGALYGDQGPQPGAQSKEWVRSHGLNVDIGIMVRALAGR